LAALDADLNVETSDCLVQWPNDATHAARNVAAIAD
jgi:hypothetical protein